MSKKIAGMGLVVIAAVLWGSIGVVVSALFGSLTIAPLTVGAIRLVFAAPLLLGWHRVVSGRWRFAMPARHHLLIVLGGFAFAGYQVAYFAAIPQIGVALAVMCNICSAPIVTAVVARIMLHERLRRGQWWALLGAVGGAVLLVYGGKPSVGGSLLFGVSCAVTAGVCYSIMAIVSRQVAPYHAPATPLAYMFGVAAVALTGVLVLTQPVDLALSPLAWLGLGYLALVPTGISYVLYVRGLQQVTATTATTLTLCEPLTSTILAVLILGEHLSSSAWFGAGVMFCCLVVFAWAQAGHTRQQAQSDNHDQYDGHDGPSRTATGR
ncbi:MAG: EamA family transporter [Chloroflexales bacterium]|nr:EamA family transporter [Chloroflexales bacterium]